MKYRRAAWFGHVERMQEHRLSKKVTEWKHTAFRPKGKSKMNWKNDIRQDIKVMKNYVMKKQAKIRYE
jgi:hypothetical protein